jgi:pyruvate carboxylase
MSYITIVIIIAIEHVQRVKADANEPGDVGCPMSGVVVEVRVKGK